MRHVIRLLLTGALLAPLVVTAARAGLQPGHLIVGLNRKDVQDVPGLMQAAKEAGNGKVLLRVRTPDGVRFVLLAAEK